NMLLQVMDAGRLTDSNGRTTDFRHVILIMTSNAGAQDVAKGTIGVISQKAQSISAEVIKKTFSPEFLNRLDAVVSFAALDDAVVLRVISKFIDELKLQLLQKQVELVVDPLILDWIKARAYDRVYGARPFARFIEEHLKKPLVDELLFGRLAQGGRVCISLKNASLDFDFEPLPTSLLPTPVEVSRH
ncbi:MAG: AAA family ATPase, partial [Bdellovibrio sp.]